MADIILNGSFLAVARNHYIAHFSTNKFFKLCVKTIVVKLSIYLWGNHHDKEIQLQEEEQESFQVPQSNIHTMITESFLNTDVKLFASFNVKKRFMKSLNGKLYEKVAHPSPHIHPSNVFFFHICFLKCSSKGNEDLSTQSVPFHPNNGLKAGWKLKWIKRKM